MGLVEFYTTRLATIGAAICFFECGLLPIAMVLWENFSHYNDKMHHQHHNCHGEEHTEGWMLYISYAMQFLLPLAILSLIFNYYSNKNTKVFFYKINWNFLPYIFESIRVNKS